jgi:serine phosphatase RsbU (regulator of sigma subunit)
VSVPGWARAIRQLLEQLRHARPEDVPRLVNKLAPALDSVELVLYVVDYGQTTLMPHTGPHGPLREPQSIDATLAGRTFTTGQTLTSVARDGHRVWLPLINGTERLGVLEVHRRAAPDAQQLVELRLVATMLGELVVSRRLYGDAVERARRRLPMQVAAEIIWNQLPPLTFATNDVAVSGILEPCYEIGGDAFDYAINGDVLHVALFDAVGHGIAASSITALATNAYRNARRTGLDLSDTYRSIDKWVHAQYPDGFLTAVLAELNLVAGLYRAINAGHPGGLLLREGRLVKDLPAPTALPLGWGHLADPIPQVTEEALQPADRVLLYTDGVVEARTASGDFFGVQRLADFVSRASADQLPAPETMRRLTTAILTHQHERLQDDATAVMVEWRPAFTYGDLPR